MSVNEYFFAVCELFSNAIFQCILVTQVVLISYTHTAPLSQSGVVMGGMITVLVLVGLVILAAIVVPCVCCCICRRRERRRNKGIRTSLVVT